MRNNVYFRLLRLDNNTGTYLMLLPILWTIMFVSQDITQLLLYGTLFTVGAFLMRSAGCIINDIVDYELDRQVKRTMNRPIASGEVTIKKALAVLFVLLMAALCILLYLPAIVAYIALVAIPMVIIYPFMKHITYYPQVMLGFTFNLGILMTWFTISPSISFAPFLLYIAGVLWTFGYDTIYAHQDRDCDLQSGIKSSAIALGERSKVVIWIIYRLAWILVCVVGLNTHMNLLFYLIMCGALYHLYWQITKLDISNPEACKQLFESNIMFGIIVAVAIIAGKF